MSERQDIQHTIQVDFWADPLGYVLYAFPWGKEGTPLEKFPLGPDKWQREEFERLRQHIIANALRSERGEDLLPFYLAIASGHGIGKSCFVAWLILFFMSVRPRCRGVATANTGEQLETKTWPELSKWHRLAINRDWFRWTATKFTCVLPDKDGKSQEENWFFKAALWSLENTEAFAGLHNADGTVVIINDEASTLPEALYEVEEGAMSDGEGFQFNFGNPTVNTGRFRECFAGGRFSHRWIPRQIDARTVDGTNKTEIANAITDWGEDHDVVRVRYRGEFPRGGAMQFIDNETVENAAKREAVSHLRQPVIMGVDCARGGDDQSAIYFRRGLDARTIAPIKMRVRDLMVLAGKVAEQAMLHRAAAVFIDEGGIGAGVVDRVRQMLPGQLVVGVNNGAKADRYMMGDGHALSANKGAEMWVSMREWLATGAIPDDPELRAELTAREYGFDAHNAIRLEKKEDMKARGLSSPDNADGLSLTFAYPVADLPDDTVFGGLGVVQAHAQDDYDPLANM